MMDGPATQAAHELARLQGKIAEACARLEQLNHELADAEQRVSEERSGTLLQANEQRVISALQAQGDAQASAQALHGASRAAELDVLTGLPNRALLLDHFALAIAGAKRHGTQAALLFLDLNNFQQINDALGHGVGDGVLKLAAQRLAAAVRETDTVSRHDGDEFLVLLAEVAHASDAAAVADQIIAALAAPHRVDGHVLRLATSIGISIYPGDGDDAATLLARADAAMCRAKRQGLGSYVFHGQVFPDSPEAPSPALPSLQRPLADCERSLAEHEHRHGQMQEANAQLVTAALGAQELQSAAEHAHRQQADFLAVLVHELRNPLAPISTAATLLGHANMDPAQLPRLQAIIERQVAHMSRLVGDLLDVARVSTGKLRLDRRNVDMSVIIDHAVDACRPPMDTRLQHFSVRVPACPLRMHGDPVRLVQVLGNLLDNASKYTPVGGRIGLTVAVVDSAIVITVSDSGIGITAEVLPDVFEAFVQDPGAIGFNGAGLGIGLTVARELVQAHGGTVVATSAGSGHGSRFVVTLPLLAA